MKRKTFLLIALAAVLAITLIGCAKKIVSCPPGAQIESKTINFICPNCGAEYQAQAIKCAGEKHYRIDTTCPVCGFNYKYRIPYWPYPYIWTDYYFYGGWWYHGSYWNSYWRHQYQYNTGTTPAKPPTPPPSQGGGGVKPPPRPPMPPPRVTSTNHGYIQQPPIPVRPSAPMAERQIQAPIPRPPAVQVQPMPIAPPSSPAAPSSQPRQR